MKLIRIAYFNLKKHKTESISLFLLITLCMTLLSASFAGLSGTESLFDDVFEQTGAIRSFIYMTEDEYKQIYDDFFEEDERIEKYFNIDIVNNPEAKYIDKSGEEKSVISVFITEENNAFIEKLILESSMSREEIYSTEHYILMPFYAKNVLDYKEGDTFEFLYRNKVYPFTVAGFYESSYFSSSSEMKMIVSKSDFSMMQKVLGESRMIGYETKDPADIKNFLSDFYSFADDNAVGDETTYLWYRNIDFENEKEYRLNSTSLFMKLMIVMSVVVFVSAAFMIGFRVKNDIEDQIVSIGVLEALGYKSGEISLSYVLEYVMITVPAVITGLILSFISFRFIIRIGEVLIGHHSEHYVFGTMPFIFGLILIAAVALISFLKAVRVRKLPPAVAFRKGTGNHTHKKNVLSMEKTGRSVHLRLAAKSFLSELRTNIGMCCVISVSVISFIICFVINSMAESGVNSILFMAGMEVSDVSILTMNGTDTEELGKEIADMPEVRKIICSNNMADSAVFSGMENMTALVYDDFDKAENINIRYGRLPRHDNEVVILENNAIALGKKLGDTITLRSGKNEADYIICGMRGKFDLSVYDFVYMTEDGYRRIKPSYVPEQVDIFLNDGEDKTAFKEKLISLYGQAAADFENESGSGTLEERIRAEADKTMSTFLDMYGVNRIDYAVQIGDTLIKGNSSRFRIHSFVDVLGLFEEAVAPIMLSLRSGTRVFMGIAALTIVMILFLVIYSSIRRQRRELGIMKGMGYTSGELIFQTIIKVLPILVVSVILGAAAALFIAGLVYSGCGELPAVTGKVILLSIAVVVFGMAAAWFSAVRIKNISVYELMQE